MEATLPLSSPELRPLSCAIDGTDTMLYIGTATTPTAYIVKISLSTFSRTDALTLTSVEDVQSLVMDSSNEYLYAGTGEPWYGVDRLGHAY